MNRTAYSYLRWSSPKQAKGGTKKRQIEAAEKYAKDHNLKLNNNVFIDAGRSGFKGVNVEIGRLSEFLRMVKTGEIEPHSTLIVESLDRLSRDNVLEAQTVFNSILLADIDLVVLVDEIVYSKEEVIKFPYLTMQAAVTFIRANDESKNKSMRAKGAWKDRVERLQKGTGLYTNQVPFWLKIEKGKIVKIAERVKIVEKIFEMSLAGFGTEKIVKYLNDKKEKSFKGKLWGPSAVNNIINHIGVMGQCQPYRWEGRKRIKIGEPVKGYYPQIIKDEDFYKVRKMKSEKRVVGRQSVNVVSNLFTPIATCFYCGSKMRYVNKGHRPDKGGSYFACSSAKRGGGCKYLSIQYRDIEGAFLKYCSTDLNVSTLMKKSSGDFERVLKLKQEIIGLEHKLKILQKNIRSIMDTLINTEDEELKENYQILLEEKKKDIVNVKDDIKVKSKSVENEEGFIKHLDSNVSTLTKYEELAEGLGNEELYALRSKIRVAIRDLIDQVIIKAEDVKSQKGHKRPFVIIVYFKNGHTVSIGEQVVIRTKPLKDVKKRTN